MWLHSDNNDSFQQVVWDIFVERKTYWLFVFHARTIFITHSWCLELTIRHWLIDIKFLEIDYICKGKRTMLSNFRAKLYQCWRARFAYAARTLKDSVRPSVWRITYSVHRRYIYERISSRSASVSKKLQLLLEAYCQLQSLLLMSAYIGAEKRQYGWRDWAFENNDPCEDNGEMAKWLCLLPRESTKENNSPTLAQKRRSIEVSNSKKRKEWVRANQVVNGDSSRQ